MSVISKLPSGSWRVQVRRKGSYASNTFKRRADADAWALETERNIDMGLAPKTMPPSKVHTLADIIDLHLQDMTEVGKIVRRSKAAVLAALKLSIGKLKLKDLNRFALIDYGKKRAKEGAGPATLAIDFSFMGTLLTHAAAVHGIDVKAEDVRLARTALIRLGLVGKSMERDRRPTQEELDALIKYFEQKPRQLIPVDRMVRFAVATAMRLEEITKVTWDDVDFRNRLITIKDRKDPRKKDGNNQRVPLLDLTGYDAWEVVLEQRIVTHGRGRIFPHHHKSAGTAFHRACKELKITDLHFHDLRHEGTSRLFEAGLGIEKVALVTGHKDWKMLRRYTNLRPESPHRKTLEPIPDTATALLPAILKTA